MEKVKEKKERKEKKENVLISLIDFVTDKTIDFFKKLGRLATLKNSHDTVYIFTKIVITLIILAIINIPISLLDELGRAIIYSYGTTFRHILSTTWSLILMIAYLLFSLMVLLKVFDEMLKDKELNFVETNRKKDEHVKKSIFNPIIKLFKVCLAILIIPLVMFILAIFVIMGMNLYLTVYGYGFISLFLILIGLLIMILSVILVIVKIIKGGNK